MDENYQGTPLGFYTSTLANAVKINLYDFNDTCSAKQAELLQAKFKNMGEIIVWQLFFIGKEPTIKKFKN